MKNQSAQAHPERKTAPQSRQQKASRAEADSLLKKITFVKRHGTRAQVERLERRIADIADQIGQRQR